MRRCVLLPPGVAPTVQRLVQSAINGRRDQARAADC